jgi:nucleoside-diphosphate-sugar epimerase
MDVAIFGAEGPTGRLLVNGALERGHEVTALTRGPDASASLPAAVHRVAGDVLDGGAVSDAVDGREAVLVVLADTPDDRGPGTVAAQGTLNVVRSMQRYEVRRLIVLSTAAVAPPGEPGHPKLLARLFDPRSRSGFVGDLRRMEVTVRQSTLDWTLARAAKLVDAAEPRPYRQGPGFALPGARTLGRAALADFLLDELERKSNVRHAVAVAS